MPNDALKKFHNTYCPELSYDDPKLTAMIVREISKLKQDIKERHA